MRKLDSQDLELMRKNIQGGIWFGLPACAFFLILGFVISIFFFQDGLTSFKQVLGFLIGVGFVILSIFFALLIVRGVITQTAEMKHGAKYVFKSIVKAKRESNSRIVDDTELLFKKSQNINRWYITVEDQEFEVDKAIYDQTIVGKEVEIHLAPETGLLLRVIHSN